MVIRYLKPLPYMANDSVISTKFEGIDTEVFQRKDVDILTLIGLIPTVSSAPTYVPRKFAEQIVLYASGGTYRLYIYDITNAAWRYATLT